LLSLLQFGFCRAKELQKDGEKKELDLTCDSFVLDLLTPILALPTFGAIFPDVTRYFK